MDTPEELVKMAMDAAHSLSTRCELCKGDILCGGCEQDHADVLSALSGLLFLAFPDDPKKRLLAQMAAV